MDSVDAALAVFVWFAQLMLAGMGGYFVEEGLGKIVVARRECLRLTIRGRGGDLFTITR